jgi:hypothetical protein
MLQETKESMLRFSSLAAHTAAAVVLSPDRLTVTQTSSNDAWVRCVHGFPPGCGSVKWAVKLGDVPGGRVFLLGVVSDAFTEYTRCYSKETWSFQNDMIHADGEVVKGQDGKTYFQPGFFTAGDVVSVELERRPGQDGVMRVRVAGKAPPQDMTGLPRDGMLYPAVCLLNDKQSYTMSPPP